MVEGGRLEPHHLRLCPVLDLEHADRVSQTDHGVGNRTFRRHFLRAYRTVELLVRIVKRPVNCLELPRRKDVNRDHPQCVQVVLLPLGHCAAFHRRVLRRYQPAEIFA